MITNVNRNPSASELKKFGLTVLIGLVLIGALLWCLSDWSAEVQGSRFAWRGSWRQIIAVSLWILGPLVWVIGRASPQAGRRLYIGWMSAALAIGNVVMPILLTVLFVILLPLFSLIRFSDPLRKKLGGTDSYWEDHRQDEATLERMQRQF